LDSSLQNTRINQGKHSHLVELMLFEAYHITSVIKMYTFYIIKIEI